MPFTKVMSIQLIKLRIINSSEYKSKKTGHFTAAGLDVNTHHLVLDSNLLTLTYCPTIKIALLRISFPDSQKPLKIGSSTK